MSRTKLLFRGLSVGYVSMACNMAYSFISIPLALKYLGKTEYGLWALVLSITSYLNFSELGMTNSVQRHLFDLKERRPDPQYGAIFLTGAVAFAVIALICLIVGGAGVHYMAPLFRISGAYETTFEWLLLGSVGLFSLSLGTRILGVPLYVYLRHDLYELSNIVLYLIWFFVLWAGLHAGFGVYSLLISQGVGFLWTCSFNIAVCARLSLYPSLCEWSRPSREIICEIAIYSRDSFLQQIGQQIVMTLPMLLISRWFGLDTAAVWAIATRPYLILRQILSKPFQYGISMLADLFANGKRDVMINRWMQLSQLMTASAVALFPVAAFNNSAFLSLWTQGKITWSLMDDLAFAVYSFILVSLFPWYGIVGIDKKYGITRFTSILEAGLLFTLCLLSKSSHKLLPIIIALIASKLIMGLVPAIINLHKVFGTIVKKVFFEGVIQPIFSFPLCLLLAWVSNIVAHPERGWVALILSISSGAILSLLAVFLFGLSKENQSYFLNKKRISSI